MLPASEGDGTSVQKSAEAIVGAGTDRRAEHERTRVGSGISMKSIKAEARVSGARTEQAGRYPADAVTSAEATSANHLRTKARVERDSGLLEVVLSRDNLQAAYQRVVGNQGAAGVDGMTTAAFKDHLKAHWPAIKARLLAGKYIPSPVRRVDIPKPQGGVRTLGIPTLTDRLIQQALHQVLQPIFEPGFSESSYGFRPGRSAHQAVEAAQRHVAEGRRVVVDMDLAKFFDRVDHDLLMGKLAGQIGDARVMKLIRRYLETGMMAGGRGSAAVEHPADGAGSGTGTPGPCVLPLRGRLHHLRPKPRGRRAGAGEPDPVPQRTTQA